MKNERVKTLVDEFAKNETIVEPAVLEVEKPEPVTGMVVDCKLLNVRELPDKDSDALGQLKVNEEVEIDMEESTEDFYKIYSVKGLEGFCMKQFIRVEP